MIHDRQPGSNADEGDVAVLSMRPGHAFSLWRVAVVLAMPVALIAAAVFLTANVQRSAALLGARQQEAALNLRGAMFDQEDGAHGLFLSQDRRYLQLWSDLDE